MKLNSRAILTILGGIAWVIASSLAHADPNDDALSKIQSEINGNQARALTDLGNLSGLTPLQTIQSDYYQADALHLQDNDPGALKELLSFVPSSETFPASRSGFIQTAGAFGEPSEALLGTLYQEAGQIGQEVKLYQQMAQDYPKNPQWLLELGKALLRSDQNDQASQIFSQITKTFPQDPLSEDAMVAKADVLIDTRQFQAALDYLTGLNVHGSETLEIKVTTKRAQVLSEFLQTNYDVSNQILQNVISKYPIRPLIYLSTYQLAKNYLYHYPVGKQDCVKARDLLTGILQAHQKEPIGFSIQNDIAISYYYSKDFTTSILQFQALLNNGYIAIPKDPLIPRALYYIGENYKFLQKHQEAKDAWNRILQEYPLSIYASLASKELSFIDPKPVSVEVTPTH